MIHASVELVEAIRGVAPWANRVEFDAAGPREMSNACGAERERLNGGGRLRVPIMACQGFADQACDYSPTATPVIPEDPDNGEVDCPACLVAIDAALEGRAVGVKE